MKVLGFDTATLSTAVAVLHGDRVLAEARHTGGGRSADLLVTIDQVCRDANVSPLDLDAVAVGAGPGSFTGLRIGMATAKGIAFAAQKPLWAVSSLAAMAFDGYTSFWHDGRLEGIHVGVLDARRSEVFAGCYTADEAGNWIAVGEERVLPPAELAAWVKSIARDKDTWFAGDAIDAYREHLAPLEQAWLEPRTPSGSSIALLAQRGPRVNFLTTGTPTYIRPSEAEVMYPDGVPGALRKP